MLKKESLRPSISFRERVEFIDDAVIMRQARNELIPIQVSEEVLAAQFSKFSRSMFLDISSGAENTDAFFHVVITTSTGPPVHVLKKVVMDNLQMN